MSVGSQLTMQKQVHLVRLFKHDLTRQTKNQRLIDYNIEQIETYQHHKYLEPNRYNQMFTEEELLGEGGFGKVFKVKHNLDQRTYAIKKIPIHVGETEDIKQHTVFREIVAISQVQHKNVVRYHACWIESVPPNQDYIDKVARKLDKQLKHQRKPEKSLLAGGDLSRG